MILWRSGGKGWLTNWLTDSLNYKAIKKTARATTCLLKIVLELILFSSVYLMSELRGCPLPTCLGRIYRCWYVYLHLAAGLFFRKKLLIPWWWWWWWCTQVYEDTSSPVYKYIVIQVHKLASNKYKSIQES